MICIRKTLRLAGPSLALLAACRCGEPRIPAAPQEKTVIAAEPSPFSAPLYVALRMGFFAAEGLDAVLRPAASAPEALDALLSGRAEFAAAAEAPLARAAVEGKPLAVVATVARSYRALRIVARRSRGIGAPGDLRGKRIGFGRGGPGEFFLYGFLVGARVRPAEIDWVELEPDQAAAALLTVQVDAVSAAPPFTLLLEDALGKEAVVLKDPDLAQVSASVVVARGTAQRSPERIRRFLKAVIRASQFTREHPADARAACAKDVGVDAGRLEREWSGYSFAVQLDQGLVLNLEDQARWILERRGAAAAAPNFLDFIDAQFLGAVDPQAMRIAGR